MSDSDSDGVPDLTPKPAFGRVPSNSSISATFNRALNAVTVDTTTFVVHSSLNGRLFDASDVVLSSDNTKATFTPGSQFFPGETVFATLTTGISSVTGRSMDDGYVWQFTGAVSASSPGQFLSGADVTSDTRATYSLIAADVDGDGDLDLVEGNGSQANRLYMGDGSGSFSSGTNLSLIHI